MTIVDCIIPVSYTHLDVYKRQLKCSDLYSNCLLASANYISSSQNNSADVNSEQLQVNIVHNSVNDESMSGCDIDAIIEETTFSLNQEFIDDDMDDSDYNQSFNITEVENQTRTVTNEEENNDHDYDPSSGTSEDELVIPPNPANNLLDQNDQSSSEREGNLNPSTEEQSNCQQVQKTRKRKKRHSVNESEWEVNKNKNAREVGEDYHGKKHVDGKWNYKIRKEGRQMKARCCCKSNPNKSKMQCNLSQKKTEIIIFVGFGR